MSVRPNSPQARDIAHVLHPYTHLAKHQETGPLILTRGQGIHVFDDTGKQYIEGLAGLWCASLGFNESELIDAAVKQMRELPYYHGFGSKSTLPSIDLAEKLKAMAPANFSKVLFVNSGSEANDTQIKLAWYYNNARGKTKKKKFISRIRAYHGITIAASSLTGLPANHRDFDVPLPGFLHTDCPHYYHFAEPGETEEEFATRLAKNLEDMIIREGPDTVAGFVAEPVMGAGGVIVPPRTYFEKIQAVLAKYDIMFIADEVICGFGRTGNPWGCQTYGITPQALSCAKQLSSAYLPIAAVMIGEEQFQAMVEGSKKIGTFGHGFTYSGHPVSAAVALRTLQIYEERQTFEHAKTVGVRFQARLKRLADHPLVGETRGVGLIGAVELVADKKSRTNFDPKQAVGMYASTRAQEHGLLIRAMMNDSIGLCPPLIITEAEVDDLFNRLEKALDETETWVKKESLRPAA
ncbi:aspartate aminotransferase family protein [Desertibaculum subflavum]|uniref:aspartate aminotransferase family protein n=1 Tax=Desertibaculum subflavum TaxID=2268458 RepID=UPI000E66D750